MAKKMLKIADFTELFYQSYGARIVNDDTLHSMDPEKDFNTALFMDMDQELGFVASCQCGHFQGNFYEGLKCPICNTQVSTEFVDSLAHKNWMGIPTGMPKVLHPIIYLMLKDWMKGSLLDAMLSPNIALPPDVRGHIKGQGYTYFYEHFEEIMHFLCNIYPKTKRAENTPFIIKMLERWRNCVFVDKLPILDPALHPMSKEGRRRIVDNVAADIRHAIGNISYGAFAVKRTVAGNRKVDRLLWKVYEKYIHYITQVIGKKLGDKRAHFRRHQLGTRLHFSFRSVIVPLVGPHQADEIHLPWKVGVNGLKLEIVNVLVNRLGYSYEDALRKHVNSMVVYDPEIDRIIKLLIEECPFKGLPVLFGRNPYEGRALLWVTM